MKKLLFFSILMMAVLSVNYSLKEPRVNTLLLDNIEALAADEQDVPTNCWGSGSVDCPVTKVKVEYVATGWEGYKMYHNAIIWQIVPPNTNRWKTECI